MATTRRQFGLISSDPNFRQCSLCLLMLVAGLVVLVGLWLLDGLPVGVMRDDAMYLVLAKSLAEGEGYRWLNVPGHPPAVHFPPAYPALLALVWRVFPEFPANVVVFKTVNTVLAALAAIGTIRLATSRLGLSPVVAAGLSLVATLGVPMLVLSVTVMSEPLFIALVLLVLNQAEALGTGEQRVSRAMAVGMLAGAATLVRTNAIAAIAAIAVVLLMRGRLRALAVMLGSAMIFVAPWQLFTMLHDGQVPPAMSGNYDSYTSWLFGVVRREGLAFVGRTALRQSTEILGLLGAIAMPASPGMQRAAIMLILALIGIGAHALGRRALVTALFLLFYALIVLMWPYSPRRFVCGVWPLIVLVFALGVQAAVAWRPSAIAARTLRSAVVAAAIVLVAGHGVYTWRGYRSRSWSESTREQAAKMDPVLRWVAARTTSTDVVAANYEPAVYLYTGRLALPIGSFTAEEYIRPRTVAQNVAALQQIIERFRPVAVVITSPHSLEAAASLVAREPAALIVREHFDGGVAFTPLLRVSE